MLFEIPKEYDNQEIVVPVRTFSKERIVCKAYNPRQANTVYFDVAPEIHGEDKFVIKIPKMSGPVHVEIYNERNGNLANDPSFQIQKPKWGPIRQAWKVSMSMDPNVSRFMRFIDWFAENAAVLSAQDSIYYSPDGKFRIDYKNVIRDESGRELTTPLRVNGTTKVMEISKKHYITYTVPGRRFWGWHEFCHVWRNADPANEFEADKGAAMIYLGSGNPISAIYEVMTAVFKGTPSDLNKQRYLALDAQIKSFNKEMSRSTMLG
jgi:hypothetical protein